MLRKPGRQRPRDPKKDKAKSNARQRKLQRGGSDKQARRHAPLIKAMANRHVRRRLKVDATRIEEATEESADTSARLEHRHKERHWGSFNAAKRRAFRDLERDLLDQSAGTGAKGRTRSRQFRRQLHAVDDGS